MSFQVGHMKETTTTRTGNNFRATVKRLPTGATRFLTSGGDWGLFPSTVLARLGRADAQVNGVDSSFINTSGIGIITEEGKDYIGGEPYSNGR